MKQEYFKITDDRRLKTSELMDMLRAGFPVYSYWSNDELDVEFPQPKETTIRYFKKQAEPDLPWKSSDDMKSADICTFRERLLMGLEYFKETGEHLDVKGWTVTSSRTSSGKIACAYWSGGLFRACWRSAGHRAPDAGGREVVSFPSHPEPSDLEKRVAELERKMNVIHIDFN